MPSSDPVSDALLNIYNLHADRRQAELDLERARTRETIGAKGAVPGVMAQLAQKHAKEQKQREANQKSGASQAMTPQAMLPPQTEVSGQARSGGGGGGLAAVGEIFKAVSGGSAVKQAAGGIGQGINPAAGTTPVQSQIGGGRGGNPAMLGGGSPVASAAGQVILNQVGQQAGPAQGQAVTPAGAPGSVVPVQQDLGTGERILSGISGIPGIRSGNPTGLIEAITGKRTIGYQRLPTVDEQASTLAPGLSVLRSRMDSANPIIAKASSQQYQKHLEEIENRLGPDIRHSADLQAEDLALQAGEVQRLRNEDPVIQAKRRDAEIELKVADHGVGSLSPGELAIFEGRQQKAAELKIIMPSTATNLETALTANQNLLQTLDQLDAVYTPEALERFSGVDRFQLQQRAKLGLLDESGKRQLAAYADFDQATSQLTQDRVRAIAGATMSAAEIDLVLNTIPNASQDPVTFERYKNTFREYVGLSTFRYDLLRSSKVENPWAAMGFSQTKEVARGVALQRRLDLTGGGMAQDAAERQVAAEFRAKYGLDVERLMTGAIPPEAR